MRRIFLTIAIIGLAISTWAEDSIAVDTRHELFRSMPGVELKQDAGVERLLNAAIEGTEEWVEMSGYRVQIYSSNQQQTAKGEALKLEDKLKDQLTQTIHVLYLPPFWKVRVGDFRTFDEAKEYKKELIQQFPNLAGDTYIVRDQVKVLK